jgi:DNA repair exonuclease SbcCD ATPase subunit
MNRWQMVLATVGLSLFVAGASLAQDNTQPQQPQQGQGRRQRGQGGQGGGNFDPAQMRSQFLQRIKEQLGATDEEFAALQPKLEKLMTAQRDTRGGGGGRGGFGRRGGGGGQGGNTNDPNAQQNQSAVAKAQAELRTVLDNKDSKPEEIKTKLTALRDAREKAKADVSAAQKDLRELLTQRQEAVLVNMGFLD